MNIMNIKKKLSQTIAALKDIGLLGWLYGAFAMAIIAGILTGMFIATIIWASL